MRDLHKACPTQISPPHPSIPTTPSLFGFSPCSYSIPLNTNPNPTYTTVVIRRTGITSTYKFRDAYSDLIIKKADTSVISSSGLLLSVVAMGSYPSKVSLEAAAHEKAVLERLRTFQINEADDGVGNDNDDGFVYVLAGEKAGCRSSDDGGIRRLFRCPEALPVELMGAWQSKVLEDPKNR